jgi:hypothetical protein
LHPLPTEQFDLSQWSRARVNIDYHIAFDGNFYSVPYNLVHELVEVRSTPTAVEICTRGRAWRRIFAAAATGTPSPMMSTAPRDTRSPAMDALAHEPVGRDHRPEYGAAMRVVITKHGSLDACVGNVEHSTATPAPQHSGQ